MIPTFINEAQIEPAADAMARAFFDDPLITYLMPDDDLRRRLSPQFFLRLVRLGHLAGETYTTEQTAGVAFWSPPGKPLTDEQMAEASMMEIPSIVGEEAHRRFMVVIDLLEEFHMRDAPEDHWYLALLGVDAPLQGQGIGSALLQPVLQKADAEGVVCYTETEQPRNVLFYQRHGFEVVVDMVEPTSGVRLWTFRREPGR